MTDTNVFKLARPGTFPDSLTEILRSGARALLTQAVEAKVADFLRRHIDLKTEAGHRRLVRHVHLPEREIMTGTGPVAVRQPRVRDRDRPDLKGRDQVTTSLLTCARSDPDRHLEGSLTTPLSSD
jgi:putative transposase